VEPGDRHAALRRRMLREWRGYDDPSHSTANVRLAGEFLARILEQTGAAVGIDEERLRQAWRSLVGDLIASQCEPAGFRDGEVSLRVLQPSMRFHLEQIKPLLVGRLRSELGDDRVRSVRFVLG